MELELSEKFKAKYPDITVDKCDLARSWKITYDKKDPWKFIHFFDDPSNCGAALIHSSYLRTLVENPGILELLKINGIALLQGTCYKDSKDFDKGKLDIRFGETYPSPKKEDVTMQPFQVYIEPYQRRYGVWQGDVK